MSRFSVLPCLSAIGVRGFPSEDALRVSVRSCGSVTNLAAPRDSPADNDKAHDDQKQELLKIIIHREPCHGQGLSRGVLVAKHNVSGCPSFGCLSVFGCLQSLRVAGNWREGRGRGERKRSESLPSRHCLSRRLEDLQIAGNTRD